MFTGVLQTSEKRMLLFTRASYNRISLVVLKEMRMLANYFSYILEKMECMENIYHSAFMGNFTTINDMYQSYLPRR